MAELDPSILLGAKSINDYATQATQQAQQAQAAQSQLQMQQYGVQQAKADFQDNQNLKAAWKSANGNPDQTIAIATKLGVSPAKLQAFQATQLKIRDSMDQHNKVVADTDKTNLDILMAKNDKVAQALEPIISIKDPSEFAARAPFVINQEYKNGLISTEDRDHALGMSQAQLSDYYTTLQSSKFHGDAVKAQTEQQNANTNATQAATSSERAKTESDKFAAEKAGLIADSQQKKLAAASTALSNAYSAGGAVGYNKQMQQYAGDADIAAAFKPAQEIAGMPPAAARDAIVDAGLTSEQRTQKAQAAATLAQQAQNNRAQQQQAAQRTAIESANLSIRQKEYEAQYGDPANASESVKNLAKGLIEGDISPSEVRRMKGGQQALGIAIATPGWTDQRYAVLKAFKSGKDADNIANLNMLDSHLDTFAKRSDELGVRLNPWSSGAARVATVANDVSGVAGKLLKGGILSKGEHDEYMSRLNSPLQNVRDAAAADMKTLVQGKVEAIKQKFKNAAGYDIPANLLSKDAQTQGSFNPADARKKYSY